MPEESTKLNIFAYTGRMSLAKTQSLGRGFAFFLRGFFSIFRTPFQISKIIEQVYFIGAKSVFVIMLTGAFTGMVLGLQGYYTLVQFGSEGLLGAAVALTLVREMGPVLSAIMIIARAGSSMAAELGIMRISEQVDALETMDIDPVRFLISPRIAASLISFPLLTALFDVVGIFGGFVTGSLLLGISPGIYFWRVESSIAMTDLNGGFIKAIVFSMVVSAICCYKGYFTHLQTESYGAKGVSSSTTSAVVLSCVMVLVVDYILTSFLL